MKQHSRKRRAAAGSLLALLCAMTSSCTATGDGQLPYGRGPSSSPNDSVRAGDAGADDPLAADPAIPPGVDGDGGGPSAPAPFATLPVHSYLSKVKSLLTGLPVSGDELARIQKTPSDLKALIASWQNTPEYQARMLDFFTMAFQQGDVTSALIANVTSFQQGMIDDRVIQNMRESFGRTVLQLIKEGAPFTDVLTTRRFMLTPALMVAMAWLDERRSGDGGGIDDALNNKLGATAKYIMQADRQIPLEVSTDPTSPDYLTFYAPQVAALTGDCRKPVLIDLNDRFTLYTHTTGETMMMFFMGQPLQRNFCVYQGRGILNDSDFNTWRMMTIRKPRAGEERTWVYDIPKFRKSSELVFVRPHVGFYTTEAFLYTWQTNSSNQARVTANQTLITAVGRKFDGTASATPASERALDSAHARPGTDCYNCHVTMDPMRQFFRNTFTYFYGLQDNRTQLDMPGVYAFDGESSIGADISDLGKSLAKNKRFALGWAHKLCTWANSAVCDPSGDNANEPTDPEFIRIVQTFEKSNFSWNVLVQELFSSPLVTYAGKTITSDARSASYSVAKKAQLCRQWDLRLGLDDVCGLKALPSTSTGDAIKTIATVLPSDSYSRGQTIPTLANDPGLFFLAGIENICRALASRVVDVTGSKYQSANVTQTVAELTHNLMGIQAPRDQDVMTLLNEHFTTARSQGASAADALRSTFMLACMSPTSVTVGQ